LKKHYEMKPKGVQINMHLGMTYEYLRDFPRAIQCYDEIVGINPVFSLAYNRLSDIALKWKGDIGKARKILEDEEHDNPPKDQTFMYLTYRYVWMDLYEGRYEKIPGELSRCPLDVFPADYFYQPKYLLYAIAYGFMNKPDLERAYYDSTRVFLEKLQKSKPEYQADARVINTLGLVYAGLGQPDQAIKLGEESVRLVPDTKNALKWPYLAENLSYIYTRAGKYPEALKLIDELLSKPGPLTTKLLEMDPRWTPLKNLPEFKKILKAYSIK
ncbi:MAG: tetratricopeptide repeat protein, partial [Bacteroidia bacterium]|nr:tetratricopeptide repeat protein [Bacteroidia bacterium]